MKLPSSPRAWPLLLALALAASVQAALVVGGTAYSKRFETKLLAEPSPLAAVSGKVGLGLKLEILETKGPWLRVSGAGNSGWVFSGNVAETKPDETKGTDGTLLAASKTTATAAARGLDPVAAGYAERRNLQSAGDDLDWMRDQGAAITADDVENYLREHHRGEFQ